MQPTTTTVMFSHEELCLLMTLCAPKVREVRRDKLNVYKLERRYKVDLDELTSKVNDRLDMVDNVTQTIAEAQGRTKNNF